MKKDYLEGVGDSLDLVVIGAYLGRGKRMGVYGAFLLACYDPDTETYQSISNIGTGFSEEDLKSHYEVLKPLESSEKKSYYEVADEIKPDVWFEPKVIWEVLTADLSLSPKYAAARGHVRSTSLLSSFTSCLRIHKKRRASSSRAEARASLSASLACSLHFPLFNSSRISLSSKI